MERERIQAGSTAYQALWDLLGVSSENRKILAYELYFYIVGSKIILFHLKFNTRLLAPSILLYSTLAFKNFHYYSCTFLSRPVYE
jgi:hypothetical protein